MCVFVDLRNICQHIVVISVWKKSDGKFVAEERKKNWPYFKMDSIIILFSLVACESYTLCWPMQLRKLLSLQRHTEWHCWFTSSGSYTFITFECSHLWLSNQKCLQTMNRKAPMTRRWTRPPVQSVESMKLDGTVAKWWNKINTLIAWFTMFSTFMNHLVW